MVRALLCARRITARISLAGALFVSMLLVGPSAWAQHTASQVTITYWQQWTDPVQKSAMLKVIAAFEKAYPSINVHEVDISGDQKILTSIAGGNPPDAASMWDITNLGDWAARGAIQNIDPMVASQHVDLTDYNKSALALSTYKDHLYGLPIEQDGYTLFINLDAFHAAGLQTYPVTMSELAADALKLTKQDASGRITQLGLGGANLWHIYSYFNGNWYDKSHNMVTPDNAGIVQALTWEQALVNKIGVGNYENFVHAQAHNPIGDKFIDGTEAMALDGDWMCALTPAYNKKLHWTAVPPPYADGHPEWKNSTSIGGAINIIPRGAAHPNEALQFLRFVGTTDAQVSFNQVIGNTPVTKSAGAKMNHGCMSTLISLEGGSRAFAWPVLQVANQYTVAVSAAEDRVIRGKASAQQALGNVQRTIQAALVAAH